jgi:hypothetical protein
MPARPAYFHRLGPAIEALRRLSEEWIDRRTLEETLGVSKTVAWRILRKCGAEDGPGGSLVCHRETLVQALTGLLNSDACEREVRRRDRLDSRLSGLLAAARSQHVRLASADRGLELRNTRFARLPAGVELTRDRLVVEFSGSADFLQKVGALVFALQNDYDAVCTFID